jgi:quercetin 2,3-dioxygenase
LINKKQMNMKTVLYPADARGSADYGWLKARYSFSFSNWYQPEKVHFGALRVLNDDIVAGGGGFPEHPHDNMEIITIPLKGALQHKDSTGGTGIIHASDIQAMSAGSGIRHSEFNASKTEAVNLLQVWIFAKEKNIQPRYSQETFGEAARNNKWQVCVSPDKADGALWINQDAVFARTSLDAANSIVYNARFEGNGFYVFVIEGRVRVGDTILGKRDAAGITGTNNITLTAEENAEILLIEVPMLNGQ